MGIRHRSAVTLVEVLIALIIIGILAGSMLLVMGPARDKAEYARFQQDKSSSENAARFHVADFPNDKPELLDLVDNGYLEGIPICIGDGSCTWSSDDLRLTWNSSDNTSVAEAALTEWGNDFEGISAGLIETVESYFDTEGHYPRSWGAYQYTDLGLDPDLWSQPIDGIIYKPVGDVVQVRPGPGVEFVVSYLSGDTVTLTNSSMWNLKYDVETAVWYYHEISSGNEIDIDSLQILR